MIKALKIVIAVALGLLFCVKVLPILAIVLYFKFFFVDHDAIELDKVPPMQNYEQNREKFLDLLAFAGRNFPKNLRVTIQSTYGDEYIWIDLDGNETKFYTNAFFRDNVPSIGEGLKLIGWDKKTFAELKSKLAAINARTIVLNRSGDSGGLGRRSPTDTWSTSPIAISFMPLIARSSPSCTPRAARKNLKATE